MTAEDFCKRLNKRKVKKIEMSSHPTLNSTHRKTLEAIFTNPVNGNIEWSCIEALLMAVGCRIIARGGSSVTFEKDGVRAYFHRPHPQKAALRYRVKDARHFLENIGVTPWES